MEFFVLFFWLIEYNTYSLKMSHYSKHGKDHIFMAWQFHSF